MICILRDALKTVAVVAIFIFGFGDNSFAQRGDPFGCRLKIRTELGIAPFQGNRYPGFWDKVDNCIRRAQGGSSGGTAERTMRSKPERVVVAKPAPVSTQTRRPASAAAGQPTEAGKSAPSVPQRAAIDTPPVVAPGYGRRVALVIGNSKYEHVAVLPNATNDANALATSLENIGFQSVTLKNDLSRDQLVTALSEFARIADNADWAAVYYSGHGIEYRGVNYMVPVDGRLKFDRDIDLEAVDVGKVSSAIDGARKLRLIILDACRDNPFLEQMKRTVASRSISRGLARVEPEAGTLIVYAAKHGETALDGEGSNSPFAQALLRRIQIPNVELRRLFDLVRDDVMATTNKRQQPYSYGSLSGSEDFYFLTK